IQGQLEKMLKAQTALFVTDCIMAESKNVGKETFQKSLYVYDQCDIINCGHEKETLSASECIMDVINNSEINYFVATQDYELQNTLKALESPIPIFVYTHGQIVLSKFKNLDMIRQKQVDSGKFQNNQKEFKLTNNSDEGLKTKAKKSRRFTNQLSLKNGSILTTIKNLME
ncbi:MAG: Small subunit processome component, partial [Paramarteilia canceri]